LVFLIVVVNGFCVVKVHHVVNIRVFLMFILLLQVLIVLFFSFYGWYYLYFSLPGKLKFHWRWKVVGCLWLWWKFYISSMFVFFSKLCDFCSFWLLKFFILKIICWWYVWIEDIACELEENFNFFPKLAKEFVNWNLLIFCKYQVDAKNISNALPSDGGNMKPYFQLLVFS
jgi:hypothetical protein